VFTYDVATEELYLNGQPDSATDAPSAGLCHAAVPVKIGNETSALVPFSGGLAFLPFTGTLDEIRIYSQAMTADDVASLYGL
jgi:hypothetical protein